jgi:hypothetical protein
MTVEQAAKRRRWPWLAGVALLVVAVAAIALVATRRGDGGVDQLAKRDYHGALACKALREWAAGQMKDPASGRPYDRGFASLAIARQASRASTADIRAASSGQRSTDLDQLRAACVAAGVGVAQLPTG